MTLLIKNVRLLGAERPSTEQVDVFVIGDKISAIGTFPEKKADTIIEGMGNYCTPGFIDVHATSDHFLSMFDDPGQEDFLKQGVTTIIGGHCGSSLAPLLYGNLDSIRKWADVDQVNVNWHTVEELLALLSRQHLGVNFGTFVGHSTIRRAIAGETLRDLTKNEIAVFEEVLRRAINEGAFGLSTGLGYVHGRGTPYPELKNLATIVARHGGIYATHLRKNGAEMSGAIEETLRLARETGINTFINHLFPARGAEKEYESTLEAIKEFGRSHEIHFGIYPFDTGIFPLYSFLPLWAQNGSLEVMVGSLKDEWMRSRIIKDIREIDPNDMIVAQAFKNDTLVGKTLKDVMSFYNLTQAKDALFELMKTTNLRALVYYRSGNADLLPLALAHPQSFITSDAPAFMEHKKRTAIKSPRSVSTFTQFLSMTIEKNLMSFEDAILKITTAPAKAFGITHRGEIKEGNMADLVVLKGAEIKYVVVNGVLAIKDGVLCNVSSGTPLKAIR